MLTLTSRERDAIKVKAQPCPKCKQKRLMPGPDYDRFRARCLNCGFLFRFKVKQ